MKLLMKSWIEYESNMKKWRKVRKAQNWDNAENTKLRWNEWVNNWMNYLMNEWTIEWMKQ